MNANTTIWLDKPADDWNEALPIGNGRLGAMVFGRVNSELIQLNEDTLWSGEPVTPNHHDKSHDLDDVRRLVFAGKYAEATQLIQSIQGPFTQSYLPLGDLCIEFADRGDVSEYRRELDISQAVSTIRYRQGDIVYTRRIFASAPDNAIVVQISADRPRSISLSATLTSPLRCAVTVMSRRRLLLSGRAPAHVDPVYLPVEPGVEYHDARGMRFAAILDGRAAGGRCRCVGDSIVVDGADSVTLFVTAATSFNGYDRSPSLDGKDERAIVICAADKLFDKSDEMILSDHLLDYRHYYDRVSLEISEPQADTDLKMPTDRRLASVRAGGIDNSLAVLAFQYGRYLLISSSRPGTIAANLQGIWNKDIRPAWSSNFTININTQMNYWLAEPTNLAELAEPLFDLTQALSVTGQDAARTYYQANGWCAGHNSDIWARANPVGDNEGNPAWANWAMGGAWLVRHLWEHYEFSGDREFLTQRAYPIIKGVAEFLLDFLVRDAEGNFVTCPSTSPENEFVYFNLEGECVSASITQSTASDRAVVREALANAVAAADLVEIDTEFADRCRLTLGLIPQFDISPEGHLLEYPIGLEEFNPGHRHLSHLYGHHPGSLITRTKTPELANAVRAALDRRVSHGGGHTGWSRAWLICQYARLGAAECAHRSITALLSESTYPNMLDAHPPFQIDGNFGCAAGIAEMLLQSHDGFIELLPALPIAWASGQVSGLRARGGIEVTILWRNGRLVAAELNAKAKGVSTIRYRNTEFRWPHSAGKRMHFEV